MSKLLAFDIGHASIGWSVLESTTDPTTDPEILGAGVVLFPTDDCLAKQRRNFRRTRRNIRATRQRIERLKRWLARRGVLSRADLDKPGHPAPFLLAAAALQGHHTLNAWEFWTVLRWYAHNRGYDGNSRWARAADETEEDTEKVHTARELMRTHETRTMAETVCACLELDPAQWRQRISSRLPYKTLNAAFPRETVEAEVRRLFERHQGRLAGLDPETARLILTSDSLSPHDRDLLRAADIKLPRRFHGGLLFGQLVPRFDNRIIARCPITYAEVYDREKADGKTDEEAHHAARREAKVPAAHCPEFLEYRFARILANLRADGRPLDAETRRRLFASAKQRGYFTHAQLRRELTAMLGETTTNLDNYFKLHPDSEKALVLDPALKLWRSNRTLKALAPHLPEPARHKALRRWRANRPVQLGELWEWSAHHASAAELETALRALHQKETQKGRRKGWSYEEFLTISLQPAEVSGRAPYARPVLRRVVEEVLRGEDPTRPARAPRHPDGEEKARDGVLYPLLDPTSRVREVLNERPLDELTNNHLVRHRLLILERLLDDLVAEFCQHDARQVRRVVVEVARELKEFSGMTAKQIASELNGRLKHFKAAVDYLKKNAPDLPLSGGLIRKCRIALDLGWTCPFTGAHYDASDLPRLQREHIIPYASRATNALHALVLTWPEVNAMKGKRTARQFIMDEGSKEVPGRPNLSIRSLAEYDEFVEKLDTKGHPDDQRRKRARKALLQTTTFDAREQDFTPGQLTQSSHLMKLALRGVARRFPHATTDPIPGPVSAELRKAWNLTGTLKLACPEIMDPGSKRPRPKDEIRGITHLHHALDASVLALAAHYLPLRHHGRDIKGRLWEALLKRNPAPEDQALLRSLRITRLNARGRIEIVPPPDAVKQNLARRLAECRVMQHVPADRSGAKAELNTWGVVAQTADQTILIQRLNRTGLELENEKGVRRWKDKTPTKEALQLLAQYGDQLTPRQRNLVRRGLLKLVAERTGKLLGPHPKNGHGKLAAIKGALVIGGNFGATLDPAPAIIEFHEVPGKLARLASSGKPVRLLRPGMLVRFPRQGKRTGIWRIFSVKASLELDLTRPDIVGRPSKGEHVWRDVRIVKLLKGGLEILPRRYTGYPKE